MMIDVVKRACEKVGGPTRLARSLKISHTALYLWKQVPAARVLSIESLTGISRHEMRPDIYPEDAA